MAPLPSLPMPTVGALIEITRENSWLTGTAELPVRFAFVATDSTVDLSFLSMQTATHPKSVIRLASRPAFIPGYEHGAVIEVYLSADLADREAVYVHFAQAGATVYFPAQPIGDQLAVE